MPKMKSKRTATKRFKVTGTGKILRKRVGDGHYMRKKSKRRKRSLEKEVPVYAGQVRDIQQLLTR